MEQPPGPDARIPVPLSRRLLWLRARVAPVAVWLGAAALCAVVLHSRREKLTVRGITVVEESVLAPIQEGRLSSIPVALSQSVEAGHAVAILDDATVQAEAAVVLAELAEARADLAAERMRLESEVAAAATESGLAARRLEVDISRAQLDVLDRRTVIETNKINLAKLRVEEQRLGRLLEIGVNEQADLDQLRLSAEAVEKSIGESEGALAAAKRELDESRQRLAAFQTGGVAVAELQVGLDPFERRIEVLEARTELTRAGLTPLILRSPISGVISAVFARPGELVQAGQPIVRVTSPTSERFIAYVPESAPFVPRVGTSVRLRPGAGGAGEFSGTVVALGPAVVPLPERLWPVPGRASYGREVHIGLDAGELLLPGQVAVAVFEFD
ncbi:HlyD family efflux transporter periplasmic adaptor subunit [Candidatus Poribacteria bacterium]|nr:HlyD family efflux transporter periplasmic adaptor subunit [Candidatus Poribacteria bacterium]